jgi:hypothetical protein
MVLIVLNNIVFITAPPLHLPNEATTAASWELLRPHIRALCGPLKGK